MYARLLSEVFALKLVCMYFGAGNVMVLMNSITFKAWSPYLEHLVGSHDNLISIHSGYFRWRKRYTFSRALSLCFIQCCTKHSSKFMLLH